MRSPDEILAAPGTVYLLLIVAATLEVLGDAFFQSAVHRSSGLSRWIFMAGGAATLSTYGLVVNLPGGTSEVAAGRVRGPFLCRLRKRCCWVRSKSIRAAYACARGGGFLIVIGVRPIIVLVSDEKLLKAYRIHSGFAVSAGIRRLRPYRCSHVCC